MAPQNEKPLPTTAPASPGLPALSHGDTSRSRPVDDTSAPPPSLPQDLPETFGRYRILKKLGQGGMGAVYLAQDQELQRSVAIKVPRRDAFESGEAIARFFDEARIVAALKHARIVPVFDVGRQADGTPFVVMEYVEGLSLDELLQRQPPSPARAAELIAEVADAVDYAHRQGFVHRDLKPANVLLDSEGGSHVVDFGLAVHESGQRSRAGEFAGTASYMAPEQVRREVHRLDGRTDIWALGVMLYELLTGRRPFAGENHRQLADEILHRDPKPLRQIASEIPEELERICLKCLAKPIAARYPTSADVARDLRRFLRPDRPRPKLLAGVMLAAVVLLAAGVVWQLGLLGARQPLAETGRSKGEPAATGATADQALRGTVDVLIWNPQDQGRRGLRLREPGALPLKAGDQVRIEAEVNRSAYLYLVWIDSQGVPFPVYPWKPGQWTDRPESELPAQRVALPEQLDRGWPMGGGPGMETCMLLARSTPLPDNVDLFDLLSGLRPQSMQSSGSVVEFHNGRVVNSDADHERGPKFFDVEQIDDAVLNTQQMLAERLGPHFQFLRAVSFANRGTSGP